MNGFERPKQAFNYAATQGTEIAIAGILDGLLQLVEELRMELDGLHREIDHLKAMQAGNSDRREGG